MGRRATAFPVLSEGPPMLTCVRDELGSGSRVTILSPHLDDAVLSCGALLHGCSKIGIRTRIVTVFNGSPDGELSDAARDFHLRCGHGDDSMSEREHEDDVAMKRLGVAGMRLGFPEALYRSRGPGIPRYPNGQDIFSSAPALEPDVVDAIAATLSGMPIIGEADMLLAPLAIGDHIDHQIVSVAAQRLGPAKLWY